MLCDKCKKKIATVHCKQTINGKSVEVHLCHDCSLELGYYDKFDFFNPAEILSSAFEPEGNYGLVCKNCGMSADEFINTGYMGCSECYKVFADLAYPMIARVQGGTQHVGKSPEKAKKPASPIEKLKLDLEKAIKEENYEEAAKLRDKIKALSDKKEEDK